MPLTTPIKSFNTIGMAEHELVADVLAHRPLSGYLAGNPRGGYYVSVLENTWAEKMGVKHAIACNSATSGLLAASWVCSPRWTHQDIAVPCFTMSATAAAPQVACDNYLYFMDCDPETYCVTPAHCPDTHVGLIIVTDLFGQCAPLEEWRKFADRIGANLIEDAAQAPFATTPDGALAGTVGDVGVFSLNVHKHMQAGEGGIIVTNNDNLAEELRGFVNHGELMNQSRAGLNLRMTEITAAIGLAQLLRSSAIISTRIELAHELSDMVKDFWAPPVEYGRHVYYHWAVRVKNRDRVWGQLLYEGIPVRRGYVNPLYRHPAFSDFETKCPVAEKAHDEDLLIFEVCAWDPTKEQLGEMRESFKRASEFSMME